MPFVPSAGIPIHTLASKLHIAESEHIPLEPLSLSYPALKVDEAYAIQQAWLKLKSPDLRRLTGYKIGLTNQALQRQLGVDQPDYGFLLDSMLVPVDSVLTTRDFIAPRIEPEIAFWLGKDLRGPGVSSAEVLAATRGVCAALELVDSRIANWQITLVDTIADNASSARVILSEHVIAPDQLDLAAEQVTLRQNGEVVGTGSGAAVLGNPAQAVAWLVNLLARFDLSLLAGQVIIPGALCAAVNVVPNATFTASFSHLGEVGVRFIA